MRLSQAITILLVTLAVAGCKIRIENPGKGSVVSNSGAYNCTAGKTCDIDVIDIFFDETFEAIPEPGYHFIGWRKRDNGLCGGMQRPCHIYTSDFEGNDTLMSFLESDGEFYLQPIFSKSPPITDVVKIDKHAWAQADLFLNLSWTDISRICSPPKGLCDGQLNGYDVTGWIWASNDDVFDLLVSLGHPPLTYPPAWQYGEASSDWAPAFYDAGFSQTFESAGRAFVAWTSSYDEACQSAPPECGITVSVVDRSDAGASDFVEVLPIDVRGTSPGRGAWFYRKASDL